MKFFGIDLGTSKCSVAYAIPSARPNVVLQPTVVNFHFGAQGAATSPAVPSVLARVVTGGVGPERTLSAFAAEEAIRLKQVRERPNVEVFRSVKSHLGTGRSYVRAEKTWNTPVKVWAQLIRCLCEMTVAEKGAEHDPRQHPTVLTVPASFGMAQRDETVEAARLAGFNVDKQAGLVQLIDEPVAALIDTLNGTDIGPHLDSEDSKHVLVFDFGGGTCDLSLLEVHYDEAKPDGINATQIAISPYQQMGGDSIDLAIMENVLWPQICGQNGFKREQLSATERKEIEAEVRPHVARNLKVSLNRSLAKLSPEQFRRQDWFGIPPEKMFYHVCYSTVKEFDLVAELSVNDLIQVMAHFMDPDPHSGPFTVGESNDFFPFANLVETTMERAGLEPNDIDILVLHGGSCWSPFIGWAFERMKEVEFLADSCVIMNSPDRTTSVARGAALYGCLSKKYGKSYIQPIVPEEMSVETVGKNFEYVVHAGQELPFKKMFDKHFYLSYEGQQGIVVPIYIGYDPERRRLAETITLPLTDQRLPQSHPVELELEIGIDKDSRWRFRAKGGKWTDAQVVLNPWIGKGPTKEVIRLQETRKKIRATVDAGQKPAVQLLAEEALTVARAGYPEEGLGMIEELLVSNPKFSPAWNIKGLIHSQRGEYQQALECYEKASLLEPSSMVIRGNCGTALMCLKRHQEAILVMREALSNDPSRTYLHSWLVDAFQALGNINEMTKELEKWHAHAQLQTIRRENDVSAWEELRRVTTRLGLYTESDEASEKIQQLGRPENLLSGADFG